MTTLVVFGDLYTTLDIEEKDGLLTRNMRMYEAFIEEGPFTSVLYLTYASIDREKIKGYQERGEIHRAIEVLTPPALLDGKLGSILYSLIAPVLHYRAMKSAAILHSFQVSGSWTGVIARILTRNPFIFRLGYPLSVRFKTEGKPVKHFAAVCVEKLALYFSQAAVVSSQAMRNYYGEMLPSAEITVVPNFVDLSLFKPIQSYDPALPILFVGRLDPVKNIEVLIDACASLGVALHLYGRGSCEQQLRDYAQSKGADVTFMGTVPNESLGAVHQKHAIYVLCSTREGMPKSLIEAMASGMLCVSTPTDGGFELIEDGVTGYITKGFDAKALEATLAQVLATMDPEVGRAAAARTQRAQSMELAVAMELEIMERLRKVPVDATEKRP
jgi:glycosyltransferase involved in cell wall biosynthesis